MSIYLFNKIVFLKLKNYKLPETVIFMLFSINKIFKNLKKHYIQILVGLLEKNTTLRPRRLSTRGSGFLLTKNGGDHSRLSSVIQLSRVLPRVENGNTY